jgi:PAS domain S-box-containing protein
LQGRYIAGDYAAAMDAASKAQPLLWVSSTFFEEAEYHFYGALARAAWCECTPAEERPQHLDALAAHYRQLQIWAKNCPENFADRAALVGAEIARIEGRVVDAEQLYEQAIHSAQESGFVHGEALANELAARFYGARGFQTTSRAYLKEARYCYIRWGADGKVRQLDKIYPYLRTEETVLAPTRTVEASVEQLDLATVINVSQAVSGEIVLDKLIDKCLRTALEHAGAERGLLMLARGTEQRVAAEATTGGETVIVQRCDAPVTAAALPESVLHYVVRTQESLILDDAAIETSFAADPYIDERQPRSILCLPLTNQAKLTGALYLENSLTTHVFSPARIAVLKLLASQAAISLENARLYRDLAEREAKIRRLVDANIIGIVVWNAGGDILEANDAFLRMVGYDREDIASRSLRWTDLTPPEWRERDERAVAEITRTGSAHPFEKEYFRKDGTRMPVLIGGALFEESRNEGVAFVLDLAERKRAEEALRGLESDLARMNRVSMMGELAASLSHEILHPIATARNNAWAGMRFLEMSPPNLDKAKVAFGCVVRDADRATDIVGRMRDHVKKAPPRKERFDLNAAINEVIVLARSVTQRDGVSVHTRLAEELLPVLGDRIQLQQVLLNLVLNAAEAMRSVEVGVRELLISTEQDQAGALVAVRDSGPGIDPAHLDRVFDAFYTTKSNGTGMGLSICRSIIDTHGGRLWASANVPRGAMFQFTVPAHSEITS